MLRRIKIICTILAFVLSCSFGYAAQEAGIIVDVKGTAWVQRDNFKHALKLKTPVFRTDTVFTDANSRVQVLFNDDTSLTIGPDSKLSIDEFIFDKDEKPQFAVKLIQGASRVISGKIVEQNPEGFKVGTPRTTVGIRGTDVYWTTSTTADYVFVQQVGKGKTVQVASAGQYVSMGKSGTLATFQAGQPVKVEKATPEQVQNIVSKVQTGGSVQVSTGSTVVVNEDLFNIGSVNNDNMTTSLEKVQEDHNKVVIDDKFNNENNNKPTSDVLASYKGGLTGAGLIGGAFGFTANLSKSTINNAYVSGISSYGSFLGVNGSGKLTNQSDKGSDYALSGFTVSTNGSFGGLTSINANGKLDFMTDRATIGGNFVFGDASTGSFNGTGSYVDNLGDIPSLAPISRVMASFKGALTGAGLTDGSFGFTANLADSIITTAYVVGSTDKGNFLGVNGTGGLTNNSYTGAGFTLTDFTMSGNGIYQGVLVASGSGNIIYGSDTVNINVDISKGSDTLLSMNGTGDYADSLGTIPTLPQYDVKAAYQGEMIETGLSQGRFGFNVNLGTNLITDAYIVNSTWSGNFVGTGGTGDLTLVNSTNSTFGIDGFTVSGNGMYDGSTTITVTNGALTHYGNTSFDYALSGGTNSLTGLASGQYIASGLGTIPVLPDFVPIASFAGATYDDDDRVGTFGFNVNLAAGTVSGAYFNVKTDDEYYTASGGTGSITPSRTTNAFSIGNFYVYSSLPVDQLGGTMAGVLDPNNLNITWGIMGSSNVPILEGIGTGSMVSGDTGGDILVNYAGTDSSGDAMGFKLNTSKGIVTDAYLYHDDIFGTVRATGGTGAAVVKGDGIIGISASGFNKDATGMYTPTQGAGIYANIFEDNTFMGGWTFFEADNNGINNGSSISGTINGDKGTGSGVPDMPTGDKIAHYKGDLNTSNSNYYFGYGSVGFDVNFAKTTDHISNAYIYGEFTSGEKILSSGGSGTLTMNTYFATYDINDFTTVGTGTFNRPGYVSTMSGQISQSGDHNRNDWQIMNGVTNVANGTANIVQGIGPGNTPVMP